VLLEQTLYGSVKMLIEILGMVRPQASSRAARLQRYTLDLSKALDLRECWQWGLAALASQIGCVALPVELLSKIEAHQPLSDEEQRLYESHPDVAGKLLAAIPRLEEVAAIVTAQFGAMSFADLPEDIRQWDLRSTGRLLLRTAVEFDSRILRGASRESAAEGLKDSKLGLPNSIQKALLSLTIPSYEKIVRQIRLKELMPGMVLEEDLVSAKGIRLVPAGQEVTSSLIVRLGSIARGVGVAEPFRVRTRN